MSAGPLLRLATLMLILAPAAARAATAPDAGPRDSLMDEIDQAASDTHAPQAAPVEPAAVPSPASASGAPPAMTFWQGRALWRDSMLAILVGAALLGYLGFFVVLRRIAFMSAALSQVSGLGVALAFWVGTFGGVAPHAHGVPIWFSPMGYAILFACLGAMGMAAPARSRRATPESVVALAYLAASALIIVVLSSPRIAQEAHEVSDLLFGNLVVVSRDDLMHLAIAAVGIALVHLVLFKDFLFCSFDPETARALGYPVRRLDMVLHFSLAIAVAFATRALGALPVFAFLVLPAGAALLFSERLRVVLVLAVGIALFSGALGYYLSWIFSLPTGPVTVALSASFWAVAGLKRLAEQFR